MIHNLCGACIPQRHVAATLADFRTATVEQSRVRDTLADYVSTVDEQIDNGRCIVLAGPTGTGKTHLGNAVLTAALRRGYTAQYTTAPDLTLAIRECYRAGTSEQVALDRFAEPDLLFLDDIDLQSPLEHEFLCLHTVLDRRYREIRPTILAGNMALDELADDLGEPIVSRIRQGGVLLLATVWDDYRIGAG